MSLYRSAQRIAGASGNSIIDWQAVGEAAKSATTPGEIDLSETDQQGYAADVRDARAAIQTTTGVEFALPDTVEIQTRHHWIDQNVATFRRVMDPFEQQVTAAGAVGDIARIANTGSVSLMLGFLARNVLGQYDPLLLADQPQADHGLYFVHPNIKSAATELGLPYPRFRRWIAFHEVTHAAEFGEAPWLPDHLTDQLTAGIENLQAGQLDRARVQELQTTMTAVEGYAELVMDAAFDEDYADLRAKLDQRRQSAGPVAQLLRRVLGFDMKRQQYQQGRAFFDAVVEARDLKAAAAVWNSPATLPTAEELEQPRQWLKRVDP